ncbi:hypothetical protein [Streptomyces subrutilus]|uniref:hypothetical protein n=1 Tax=Streptomyces subrutilus TaxID=36818 RepID=UPI0033C743F6
MDESEPPEHARYRQYLQALAHVSDEMELAVVRAVLTDDDLGMACAAVLRHIELRSVELLREPEYTAWEQGLAQVVAGHPYVVRRLSEESLFRAIELDLPWTEMALREATDWLQRLVSHASTSPVALTILAENGRTRRVRNAARLKIKGGAAESRSDSSRRA